VTGADRRGAEADAVARLRRHSRAEVKVAATPRCLAMATVRHRQRAGRRRVASFAGVFTRGGDSREEAAAEALRSCESEKGDGRCRLRDALCPATTQEPSRPKSGGNVAARFDRDVPPVTAPPPRRSPQKNPANARPPRE
jgi:hypothetical protein